MTLRVRKKVENWQWIHVHFHVCKGSLKYIKRSQRPLTTKYEEKKRKKIQMKYHRGKHHYLSTLTCPETKMNTRPQKKITFLKCCTMGKNGLQPKQRVELIIWRKF